ncbi:hypothetical protein SD70_07210 [Gordoniibacillus kamchatkensis]|uniref:Phosphatidic acid phosphatase type 2/haloperoxidase domain-containing protein n=1 Tax=Gordoniibacillus kamchatkensis TaxID=1590651 RepID=A0ABR5ALM6_9BACL|nr:phosphatase PAP2 family protein [Paenibacillus sp. VKM B-2647]KIL41425.1 hypothetical protein SD70_07210 [Paenibacillus sp. VKM B-2647]
MSLKIQLSRAFVISLICVIGFGAIALMIGDNAIAEFDRSVAAFIQGLESPPLTQVMIFFTNIGAGWPVVAIAIAIMAFLYIVLRHRKELLLFVAVVAGSTLLNEILKHVFQRARPVVHRIVEANGFSFPSGHSMAAFSLYGVASFLLWRHIPTAFGRVILILISVAMIALIGISRIYLGVHYPSDVLGGFLASGAWLAAAIWFYQRYQEKSS